MLEPIASLKIEVSRRNYKRLVELKQKTGADSVDEIMDLVLDFWYSWYERKKNHDTLGLGYDT